MPPSRSPGKKPDSIADFCNDLKTKMVSCGLSQRAFAGHVHYSPSSLSTALSSTRLPTLELTLKVVEKACEITRSKNTDEQVAAWKKRWNALKAASDEAQPPRVIRPTSVIRLSDHGDNSSIHVLTTYVGGMLVVETIVTVLTGVVSLNAYLWYGITQLFMFPLFALLFLGSAAHIRRMAQEDILTAVMQAEKHPHWVHILHETIKMRVEWVKAVRWALYVWATAEITVGVGVYVT